MSLWRQNHVNPTTNLRDILYNQNNSFLGGDNMGEIRISIPNENLQFPYRVCKKSCYDPKIIIHV